MTSESTLWRAPLYLNTELERCETLSPSLKKQLGSHNTASLPSAHCEPWNDLVTSRICDLMLWICIVKWLWNVRDQKYTKVSCIVHYFEVNKICHVCYKCMYKRYNFAKMAIYSFYYKYIYIVFYVCIYIFTYIKSYLIYWTFYYQINTQKWLSIHTILFGKLESHIKDFHKEKYYSSTILHYASFSIVLFILRIFRWSIWAKSDSSPSRNSCGLRSEKATSKE